MRSPLTPIRANPSDIFTVWISSLNGATPSCIYSQADRRQINHCIISPNGRFMSMNRYNNVNTGNGSAVEVSSNYTNTEVLIADFFQGGYFSIQLPATSNIFCNACWDPNSDRLYIVTNNATGWATYDISTDIVTPSFFNPSGYVITDPTSDWQPHGLPTVFPASVGGVMDIYQLLPSGVISKVSDHTLSAGAVGDTDPQMLRDCRSAIFSRSYSNGNSLLWKCQLFNNGTIVQTQISPTFTDTPAFDGAPAHSLFDESILCWHFDQLAAPPLTNCLMRISADGSVRTPIAGINGLNTNSSTLLVNQPSLWAGPTPASDPDQTVVYSAQIQSQI